MGLDVYLVKYNKDRDDVREIIKRYQEESERIWEEEGDGRSYEAMTQVQKESARNRADTLAAEMGLDQFGDAPADWMETIEIPSEQYPDHLFKIGYFRSSYNPGGIDQVMGERIGKSIGWIFGWDYEEPETRPDWRAAIENAKQAKAELAKSYQGDGRIEILESSTLSPKEEPKNEREARDIVLKELEKYRQHKDEGRPSFPCYTNAAGFFSLEKPFNVIACVHGERFGLKCAYLAYLPDEDFEKSYLESIDIMIETCEYVLKQPVSERSKYWLLWSY